MTTAKKAAAKKAPAKKTTEAPPATPIDVPKGFDPSSLDYSVDHNSGAQPQPGGLAAQIVDDAAFFDAAVADELTDEEQD